MKMEVTDVLIAGVILLFFWSPEFLGRHAGGIHVAYIEVMEAAR